MTAKEIMNSPLLYILVVAGIVSIFLIAMFFFQRARKRALEMGVSNEKIKSVIKSSIIFSIIPSISIIIGLITLTPLLGIPWPWFRLSVVGSLGYELTAADLSVQSAGFADLAEFSANGDGKTFGAIMLVMSIAIMGGMVFNIFALKKVHTGVADAGEKDSPFRELALSVLTIGMFSVFVPTHSLRSPIHALTLIISAAVTYILTKISKEFNIKWLGDYVMSFALIIGMAAAVVLNNIMG